MTAVAALVYSAITSLDGFTADAGGGIGWAEPDPEVHAFINEEERRFGTHLYGRRMYEALAVWETMEPDGDHADVGRDFATIWRSADKVVYSSTLDAPWTARTRVERRFEPAAVRALKAATSGDLSIGGATLAGQALAAGLVDELQLFVCPVAVGGGTPALPEGVRVDLELRRTDRFASGVVHLHYRVAHPAG